MNTLFSKGSFLLMNSVSNLFFTDIDFSKPWVIHVLDLNLSLQLFFQEMHRHLTTNQSYLNTYWLNYKH